MNKPFYLVLTKEHSLYPRDEIFLLGAWCINYSNNIAAISAEQNITLPYPFATIESLQVNYHYLKTLDKNLFPPLCQLLNQFHRVNYSHRYWRILIGYWWWEFLDITYSRYICLQEAANRWPQINAKIVDQNSFITPYNTNDFSRLSADDFYNHQLLSQLIPYISGIKTEFFHEQEIKTIFSPLKLTMPKRNIIKKILCYGGKKNELYFSGTFLKKLPLTKIALSLKLFPTLLEPPNFIYSNNRYTQKDIRVNFRLKGFDKFSTIIGDLLSIHFPTIYLEDFAKLQHSVKKYFPAKPIKAIFTAACYASNESFKLFAAEQVEKYQTPYIIAQHGGCYGSTDLNHCEDYEKEIASFYLTFGWNEKNNPKIIPFIVNRFKHSKKKYHKKSAPIIWILTNGMRYPRLLYPGAGGPSFANYLDQQVDFLLTLPHSVRKKLCARLYCHAESGWDVLNYLEQKAYPLTLSNHQLSLEKEAKKASLMICTYNGTAHLETFALNIPTLLYWDKNNIVLRPDAKPIHQKLFELGILHDDAKQAAKKLALIHENSFEWWWQPAIQQARNEFCSLFANTTPNYTKTWQQMFKRFTNGFPNDKHP